MEDAKAALALRLARGEISKAEYHDLLSTISQVSPIAQPIARAMPPASAFEPVTFTDAERQQLYTARSNSFAIDFIVGVAVLISVIWGGNKLGFDRTDVGFLSEILIGCIYFFIKDGLPNGRSLGKLLFRIRTVQVKTRRSCGVLRSLARNLLLWCWVLGGIVVVALFIALVGGKAGVNSIGFLGGLVLVVFVIPVMSLERSRIRKDICGQKLSDKWTGTQVVFANKSVLDQSDNGGNKQNAQTIEST